MSKKTFETEWSFSFDKIADKFGDAFGDLKGTFSSEEVKTANFNHPLGKTKSAVIELGAFIGEIRVKALEDSKNLFEADLSYIGEIEFNAEGETEATVTLKQKPETFGGKVRQSFGSFGRQDSLLWDVRINPNIPVTLKLNGGAGESSLDLSQLKLTNLEIDGGVGKTVMELPESPDADGVHVDGGVGKIEATLPPNTSVDFKVAGGVGAIKLYIPEDDAAKASVSNAIGKVKVPPYYERVSDGDNFISTEGVWQTPNFDDAEHAIVIHHSGGVGSFRIMDI
jgi:hypothetical protein